MDRLRTIESFVRVVKAGSFSAAAEQLGMSRAIVTKRVIDLEKHLGARLLNRTTRKVAPTEIGTAYYEFCARMLGDLEAADESIKRLQSEPEGRLRILAPKSFGSSHLATAVSQFALEHSKISISLVLDDSATHSLSFAESEIDVAIRLSPIASDSAVVARQIGSLEWVVCASPAYLESFGPPKRPADLARARCIVHLRLASDRIWRFAGAVPTSVKVKTVFTTNSVLAVRRAALAGVGVAQLPTYYAGADLKSGALQKVLVDHPLPERPVYAVFPAARFIPRKVGLFVKFLADWYALRTWDSSVA
jgi:DNA-binding transcriptional LysR family regulator